MTMRFPELPAWELAVDRASAGVCAIRAIHSGKTRFEKTGTEKDRDRLLEEAKRFAIEIEALRAKRSELP